MFWRKKRSEMTAPEARIIAHLGLEKRNAKRKEEILSDILSSAEYGVFQRQFYNNDDILLNNNEINWLQDLGYKVDVENRPQPRHYNPHMPVSATVIQTVSWK
jgi:hypothetical protein